MLHLSDSDQQKALSGVISRIRESLDIETIFKTTVTEVRQLLNTDRVAVFRFYPELEWEGEFIYEDVVAEWNSALSFKLRDHCFAAEFARQYEQGRINFITDIHETTVSDCHVQMLQAFQVRANIAAPLMKGKDLWGLLCIHQCSSPRQWNTSEIEFVQLIAEHLGVALQQADYLEQTKIQSAQLAEAKAREKAAEWQKTIAITIEKIRQTLDIEIIFRTSTEELRRLLNADRVAIYRFHPDWSGEFAFESVGKGWRYLMDEQLIQPKLRENISECTVKDIAKIPAIDTYLQDTAGGNFTRGEVYRICNDIYNSGFSDCYLEILESYQAKAYVIMAIYHGHKLWGLLAVYQNTQARYWQEDEVYLLTQVGTQLGVALQQAEFLQQMKTQAAKISKAAERQKALANTIEKIRQSLDIDTIFKTTTQEVLRLLEVERVAIYRFYPDQNGKVVADSMVDGERPSIQIQPLTERVFSLDNQRKKSPHHEAFVPICQGEKLWGLLVAYQNSQPRDWQEEEINLLAQVGVQLGVALQQAESLQQVQIQAENLAKAAKRERKAAEREKALAATVEKIRHSLDIDTIFKAATEEVQRLLEVDRVTIYRFNSDWSGEFVSESVAPSLTPVPGILPMVADGYLQTTQGSDFANGKVLMISDIDHINDTISQIPLTTPILVRALMIVPIFQGDKLWGLLSAYHNIKPRNWQEEEKNLLVQIGNQLGVGIQQAELLEQTQRQKEAIAQTLKDLKQAQSQLIQNEKMAGLGQLVAGIAHEINNPITFIYGNVHYVNEHTENLLQLLHLYEQQYPEPTGEIIKKTADLDLEFIVDDLPKILNSMIMGTNRISQLVLSLRNFSRLDESGMKPVDLHEGIDSTLLILKHRLQPQDNSFAVEVVKDYGNLPPVLCYAAQMNQVFMNIINNAIDALEQAVTDGTITAKPQICISTEIIAQNKILIGITDNGCGVSENLRSRIFEPFFTTKQPGKGPGLGLSISYQIIVEKHGGKIECVSEFGQGSEFWLEIPIKQ
ncbi:MAG TPA: GAF domain-containing protein [Nodularia sp. (in: cyanobacteria)]|nr:GAF domain-containing protein [Nodularia sp. (in: cyanobacteria)]